MRAARLDHALGTGALSLPEGRIAVFRPRAGDDLSALPRGRVQVVTGFRPDHDAFVAQGYPVARRAEGDFAMALVCLPRARDHARALVAEAVAAAPVGLVVVDGQKTDGVDAMLKALKARGVAVSEPLSKAHGKLFSFSAKGADLSDWAARETRTPEGMVTLPGVFSAGGADRGSALLAAHLPPRLPPVVADLGAGWGWLSAAALAREGLHELHLIEAEADALDCARRNVADPRARFHWADARTFRPERPFDAVICNPPFHEGRAADPVLGAAFVRAAAGMLAPAGVLWLVANRHLPYARVLAGAFREVEEAGGDSAFRIWRAARPVRR